MTEEQLKELERLENEFSRVVKMFHEFTPIITKERKRIEAIHSQVKKDEYTLIYNAMNQQKFWYRQIIDYRMQLIRYLEKIKPLSAGKHGKLLTVSEDSKLEYDVEKATKLCYQMQRFMIFDREAFEAFAKENKNSRRLSFVKFDKTKVYSVKYYNGVEAEINAKYRVRKDNTVENLLKEMTDL
jgi:hypothetical protein